MKNTTIQPKDINRKLEKIKKLETQYERVQDTEFGTEEGRIKLNALNGSIGRLEDEVRQMLQAKYNLKKGDRLIKVSKGQTFKIIRDFEEYGKEQRIVGYLVYPLVKLGFLEPEKLEGVYSVNAYCTYGLKPLQ